MRTMLAALLCSTLTLAAAPAFAKKAAKPKKEAAKSAPGKCMDKEDPSTEQLMDGDVITTKQKCEANNGKWMTAAEVSKANAGKAMWCKNPASNSQAMMTPAGELITDQKACDAAQGVWTTK